jgi:hypothetical protein
LSPQLFAAFFPVLSSKQLLESHLELLMLFMVQKNENLAKTGAIAEGGSGRGPPASPLMCARAGARSCSRRTTGGS